MTAKSDDKVGSGIILETLVDNVSGRIITYGRAGDLQSTSSPVLFFPALGGTRRMLLTLHDEAVLRSLHVICVDRPGTGGTSKPSSSSNSRDHMDTGCSDVLAVLDFLHWERVGVLAVCAGTALALVFSSQYPTRTTGRVVLVAPWVLPADCPNTKWLYRFAAHSLPTRPVSSMVASLEMLFLASFSSATIARTLRDKVSGEERKRLDAKYDGSTPSRDLAACLDYMLPSGQLGDSTNDVAVCLSASNELGLDYQKIGSDGNTQVRIWHGDQDALVPLTAAQWLTKQIPNAELKVMSRGTHGGALFTCVTECLNFLKV